MCCSLQDEYSRKASFKKFGAAYLRDTALLTAASYVMDGVAVMLDTLRGTVCAPHNSTLVWQNRQWRASFALVIISEVSKLGLSDVTQAAADWKIHKAILLIIPPALPCFCSSLQEDAFNKTMGGLAAGSMVAYFWFPGRLHAQTIMGSTGEGME